MRLFVADADAERARRLRGNNITIHLICAIEQPHYYTDYSFPEAIWRIKRKGGARVVYLTFDDGPIPEETPWCSTSLDRYGIKATFLYGGRQCAAPPRAA